MPHKRIKMSEGSLLRDKFPIIVHIMLIQNEEVFLLRRQKTGVMDGWYGLPGGHMEYGETVKEAAIRECVEEAGVEINTIILRDIYSYRFEQEQGLNFVFFSEDWVGMAINAEPVVFDDARYFPLRELPGKTIGWVRASISSVRSGRKGVSLIEDFE